ncbi:hypothetical protein CDD81_4366 [Ophiocordyceps australis]|uniref:Uncharacterized protein n=1 Tax=Ophiocordyceps australis TaxID=1399860 RepID=A0A2C5XTP4_9HYPO|nr:hypothetical protein CDD81_4366 [Ophiocordyceps australis]
MRSSSTSILAALVWAGGLSAAPVNPALPAGAMLPLGSSRTPGAWNSFPAVKRPSSLDLNSKKPIAAVASPLREAEVARGAAGINSSPEPHRLAGNGAPSVPRRPGGLASSGMDRPGSASSALKEVRPGGGSGAIEANMPGHGTTGSRAREIGTSTSRIDAGRPGGSASSSRSISITGRLGKLWKGTKKPLSEDSAGAQSSGSLNAVAVVPERTFENSRDMSNDRKLPAESSRSQAFRSSLNAPVIPTFENSREMSINRKLPVESWRNQAFRGEEATEYVERKYGINPDWAPPPDMAVKFPFATPAPRRFPSDLWNQKADIYPSRIIPSFRVDELVSEYKRNKKLGSL